MYLKRLNSIFRGMKDRCYNPKNKFYDIYGKRGITVCDEWYTPRSSKGYHRFRDWALSNGYKDNLSIDRIDNNKGYSPENCRWSTVKEQSNNRRFCTSITYRGKTQTLAEWCDELHLNYWSTRSRLNQLGWSVEKAFSTNGSTRLRMITYKGKTQPLKNWCNELGLNYYTTASRLNKYGWSIEKAFGQQTISKNKQH